jgi:hypothetical protein
MSNNLVQLGTIISSVLNYDQLNDSLGEPRGCHQNSTYAPCDGRTINGSKLANLTDRNQVPDLRGQFIRGLNSFHLEGQPELNPLKSDPDGLNRKVGDYQPDGIIAHNHPAHGRINGSLSGSNNSHDVEEGGDKFNSDPNLADHDVQVTVNNNEGGLVETRPKNVSVNFYIKIN